MNVAYRLHPSEYELGENEKFYGGMEAKGWRLERRGTYFSRFVRVKPSAARYRIEVSAPRFLDESGLSEEQLAVFEDCGWEYVDSQGFLHIFRASEGSAAPEFYSDPRQQAATLNKIRRDLWWGWGALVLLPVLLVVLPWSVGSSLERQWWKQVHHFVDVPGYVGFYLFWMLLLLYQIIWSTWRVNRTYQQLRRGTPLDHAPKSRRLVPKLVGRGLALLVALSVLSVAVQAVAAQSVALPEAADGPYLLFCDLGVDGERSELLYGKRESCITRRSNLITDHWDVFEVIETPEQGAVWMYQDIYHLRFSAMGHILARALLEDSVFARNAGEYDAISVPGLDAAWVYGNLEAVAVKGDLVAHLQYLGSAPDGLDSKMILSALALRWGEE